MVTPAHAHPKSDSEMLQLAQARCKSRGVQLTPIRRKVLEILHSHENGLKAYELLACIQEHQANATPPTVYRALDFLIEHGLVHKIESINQFIACRHESHPLPELFMICRHCGKITELHDHALMQALMDCIRKTGHQPDCREVEVTTTCPDCLPAPNVNG